MMLVNTKSIIDLLGDAIDKLIKNEIEGELVNKICKMADKALKLLNSELNHVKALNNAESIEEYLKREQKIFDSFSEEFNSLSEQLN